MSGPASEWQHSTDPPHALILAAGVGRRLGLEGQAKCLLEFAGLTLLARHLRQLRAHGVGRIAVVVGHDAARVRAAAGADVTCLLNPDFREGSLVSLWTARDLLRAGTPILLMDADVIYDSRLMARLLDGHDGNRLLLDRDLEPGDEPVKICVAGGRIVDFRKRPSAVHDWHGESVGFFRFDAATARELADRCEDYVGSGRRDTDYEEPIRDMILESDPGRFGFVEVTGLPWTEIDFSEDVEKALALLPELVG